MHGLLKDHLKIPVIEFLEDFWKLLSNNFVMNTLRDPCKLSHNCFRYSFSCSFRHFLGFPHQNFVSTIIKKKNLPRNEILSPWLVYFETNGSVSNLITLQRNFQRNPFRSYWKNCMEKIEV